MNAISPLVVENTNPALVGMAVRGTLEAEIQQGNLRLQELEEETVWLRKKSALVDAEVKKLQDKRKEYFLAKKTRMVRQGAYDHADRYENYCCELISLMPWIGPHIAKHSDQGSTLQMVNYTMPTVTIRGGDSLGTMMEDRMQLYIGGVAT